MNKIELRSYNKGYMEHIRYQRWHPSGVLTTSNFKKELIIFIMKTEHNK